MRNLFIIFLLVTPTLLKAQYEGQNSLKVNAVGAFSQLYALQYERKLNSRLSFNNTFFYRSKKQIPFGSQFDKLAKKYSLGLTGVDFEYIFVNEAKIGVIGYSPELRYYFGAGKNRWFTGLFGQYENFDATIPASMEIRIQGQFIELSKVPIDFKIITLSGGILIGKQFKLAKNLALDVVLIGPHFGQGQKVHGVVEQSLLTELNEEDRDHLKARIRERFKLSEKYYEVSVGNEKAEIKNFRKIPYGSIRGLGFNLGFYF